MKKRYSNSPEGDLEKARDFHDWAKSAVVWGGDGGASLRKQADERLEKAREKYIEDIKKEE
jgi:hypothetical protein